ncbi:MAG: hypothetical protein IJ106_07575 [Parasporobacterium sp.]|nr:hypothetical protein [Parasporobacterium sp.]
MEKEALDTLYGVEGMVKNRKEKFRSIYTRQLTAGIVLAAYLAWSFISSSWDRSWIIWPVAGVAYGAFYAVIKAVHQKH